MDGSEEFMILRDGDGKKWKVHIPESMQEQVELMRKKDPDILKDFAKFEGMIRSGKVPGLAGPETVDLGSMVIKANRIVLQIDVGRLDELKDGVAKGIDDIFVDANKRIKDARIAYEAGKISGDSMLKILTGEFAKTVYSMQKTGAKINTHIDEIIDEAMAKFKDQHTSGFFVEPVNE